MRRASHRSNKSAKSMSDSTALQPGRPASLTLAPSRTYYFHIDVPLGRLDKTSPEPILQLRLVRNGGDPVLMASVGQWPVVDLAAEEDMVRAHYCAFDAFHADAEVHNLTIPDAASRRPDHATIGGSTITRGSGAVRDPRALSIVPSRPGAIRWAIGVHNVALVKSEPCTFTLTAHLSTKGTQKRALPADVAGSARDVSGRSAGTPGARQSQLPAHGTSITLPSAGTKATPHTVSFADSGRRSCRTGSYVNRPKSGVNRPGVNRGRQPARPGEHFGVDACEGPRTVANASPPAQVSFDDDDQGGFSVPTPLSRSAAMNSREGSSGNARGSEAAWANTDTAAAAAGWRSLPCNPIASHALVPSSSPSDEERGLVR